MELLNDLIEALAFNPGAPLTFTRIGFWGFFAAVLVGFAFLERRIALRNAFLFAVSLFFYWKTSGWFFLILLFSTGTDWWIGRRIGEALGDHQFGHRSAEQGDHRGGGDHEVPVGRGIDLVGRVDDACPLLRQPRSGGVRRPRRLRVRAAPRRDAEHGSDQIVQRA